MANNDKDKNLSKKRTRNPGQDQKGARRPADERQAEREKQSGRGSGEGKSGFERGDGHPTGR